MRAVLALTLLAAGCDQLLDIHHISPRDAADDVPDSGGDSFGCSDGTREGYTDLELYPNIAACGGAWSIPGVKPVQPPACDRKAGNTGDNILGDGCNVSDLCAPGWDVCSDHLDVLGAAGADGCGDAAPQANQFFATRQSGPGGSKCGDGVDDVFGCGTIGIVADPATCAPLTMVSDNDCFVLRMYPGGWTCTNPGEANNILKTDPQMGGGVLCCRIVSK